MTNKEMRDAFESWAKNHPWLDFDLRVDNRLIELGNDYVSDVTKAAYEGWQACEANKPAIPYDPDVLQSTGKSQTEYKCSCGNVIRVESNKPQANGELVEQLKTFRLLEQEYGMPNDTTDKGEMYYYASLFADALQANNPLLELVEIIEDDEAPQVGDLILSYGFTTVVALLVQHEGSYPNVKDAEYLMREKGYTLETRNCKPAIKRCQLKGGV